jgi:hypothetical protein
MNDYKEYFKQHDEIKNRVIEICQLFHRYDSRLYHDIAIDDIFFFYDNNNNICVVNDGIIELDFYCIFDVSYLTMSNDFIGNEITIRKKDRDEYDKICIDKINKKKSKQ